MWHGRVCVALACAHVCVQDIARAHVEMKSREKNVHFMFITLVPSQFAPVYWYGTNAFVYNPYMLVCYSYVTCMYSNVTLCTRMLLVCTRMLLVCALMLLACHP